MRGRGIELILMRQLASCLATPMMLSDARGELLFLNEPAEELLGFCVGDASPASVHALAERLVVRNPEGQLLPPDDLPSRLATLTGHPVQRRLRIRGSDGLDRWLEATAFPLVSPVGENVGIVSILWEAPDEG